MHILAIGIQDQIDYLPPERENRKAKITRILNMEYNPRPNCWEGRVGPGKACCQYFDYLGTTGTIMIYTTLENLEYNLKSTLTQIQLISPKFTPKFAGLGNVNLPIEMPITLSKGDQELTNIINNLLENPLEKK